MQLYRVEGGKLGETWLTLLSWARHGPTPLGRSTGRASWGRKMSGPTRLDHESQYFTLFLKQRTMLLQQGSLLSMQILQQCDDISLPAQKA